MDSVEDVRRLLDDDSLAVDLPMKDRFCEVPLLVAARAGCSVPVLAELLGHGASVNVEDREGLTALDIVVNRGARDQVDKAAVPPPVPPFIPRAVAVPLLLTTPPVSRGAMPRPRLFPATDFEVAVVAEEELFQIASCLLSFGARATREGGTIPNAADHANALGYPNLANLIQYWGGLGDFQRFHIVAQQARRAGADGMEPCMATLLPSLFDLIGGFLIPVGLRDYCLGRPKTGCRRTQISLLCQ